jgi:hypothetical protein
MVAAIEAGFGVEYSFVDAGAELTEKGSIFLGWRSCGEGVGVGYC